MPSPRPIVRRSWRRLSNPPVRRIADHIRETAQRLENTSQTPRVDAEYLVALAAGISRPSLLARLHACLALPDLDTLVERRQRHEPIAYILGEWEFYGIELEVAPPALVPRPETEHLVEVGVRFLRAGGDPAARALDLCTGTGCVAIALASEVPGIALAATEINDTTLALAARNVSRHRLGDRIALHQGDLFDALPPRCVDRFDLIVSNPPYVSEADYATLAPDIRDWEDPSALLGGADGLDLVRRIVREAPAWLRSGGMVALEIGDEQAPGVMALLREAGYRGIAVTRDLAGIDRIVSAVRPG